MQPEDIDYYPYGGVENDYCPNVAQNYKFTGKERDTESGLDMFGARYYGSSLGRFMTPDWAAKPTNVPYASFGNPQSLNLYSYVNNNPTTTRDPDGHCPYNTPGCTIKSNPDTKTSGLDEDYLTAQSVQAAPDQAQNKLATWFQTLPTRSCGCLFCPNEISRRSFR